MMNQGMKNYMEKFQQRRAITKQIFDIITTEIDGVMEINGNIDITYTSGKTSNFTYQGKVYNVIENTFRKILAIKDLQTSILLEEVLKCCLGANRKAEMAKL